MKIRSRLIFIPICLVFLNFIQVSISEESESSLEKLEIELKINDLELIDNCENIANAKKIAYLKAEYKEKIAVEEAYGNIIKLHYEVLKEFENVPTELERNLSYQVKPGDGLLPEKVWKQFVAYKNHIEEVQNHYKLFQLRHSRLPHIISNAEYHNILKHERNYEWLNSTWTGWSVIYNVTVANWFSSHLQLIKQAAILNGFESVESYWETLVDFPGAYDQAGVFWEEISPFYKRLVKFVKNRLFKYYNITKESDEIPVLLSGIPFGSDWSNIADIILPHPQLHFDVESYLKYKNVKDIYKYSENILKRLGLGTLGEKFWRNSKFNASGCGPEIFVYCDSGFTEVWECNQTSWKLYLDAHETALKVALNNLDYLGLPRHNLRYSSVDSAVETLGSLIAIESLSDHGILNSNIFDNDDNSANMTKLLLTALRVMPRLSYYIMADKWRVEEIKLNSTGVNERYWTYRKKYNGIQGITNTEPEYLYDPHLVANKPYISKFFGILVAFQLVDYYREQSEDPTSWVKDISEDNFLSMLNERDSTDWAYLLTLHYGLEPSAAALLKYFEPLEHYLETAPSEQVPVVTTTTTTTTTTTSTTTTTTTTTTIPKPITKKLDLDSAANGLYNVANDEPIVNSSSVLGNKNSDSVNIKDSHVGMWIGVALLVGVACLLVAGYVYRTQRKKRRTNNRRFDT